MCSMRATISNPTPNPTLGWLGQIGSKVAVYRGFFNPGRLSRLAGQARGLAANTAPGSPLSRTAGEGAERQRREASEGSPPALALPDKPSIAVLPFANISGDPEQEYFADGMVEEIITALSRIHWLFVIARNSRLTYKAKPSM
jgi:hypothetical protein